MKIYVFSDTDRSYRKSSDRSAYEFGYAVGKVLRFLTIAGASFCVTKAVMFLVSLF